MSEKIIRAALDLSGSFKRPEFILSGGEPLLVWPKVRGLIRKISRTYPASYISVQSNALLLDRRKIGFLKEHRVNVEVGIDGDEKTMRTNRRGAGGDCYRGVCRALELLGLAGVSSTTTMTVYPQGAGQLLENLKHLDGLGARHIEIHPAFMEAWDTTAAKAFLTGYRQASAYALKTNRMELLGRGYSEVSCDVWDMVILPDGKVLPNWTFLSFPERVRKNFYIMDLASGRPKMLPAASAYFDALQEFVSLEGRERITYRQVSNYNAALAITRSDLHQKKAFSVYSGLCHILEKIDQDIADKVASTRSAMNRPHLL